MNASPNGGTADGERRKREAHALLVARREVYILRGRRAMLRKILDGDGQATADDVRAGVDLPADIDARCLGTVPGRLAYDGVIRPAGFTRSTRPERHASWLQVWELADRAAAEAWLRHHPDRPDPGAEAPDRLPTQGTLFSLSPANEPTPTGSAAGAGESPCQP